MGVVGGVNVSGRPDAAGAEPAGALEGALAELDVRGWTKIENAYDPALLAEVRAELQAARPLYARIQEAAGVGEASHNAMHHTVVACRSNLKLLDPNPTDALLTAWFGGKYILNTMGASFVEPGTPIYTHKIHRDLRSFSGDYRLQINTLIMLDDSTEENGATWMASGSHRADAAPAREDFFKTAERATGKAGDVLVFDGNIWHCAGENSTDQARCIITPIFSRPFVKQALDYPAAFGPDFGDLVSDNLRQLLGYNALTPTSLREFYQPSEKRFYRNDQG